MMAVISEDSDLIPFGCKRICYKMDKQGHGSSSHPCRPIPITQTRSLPMPIRLRLAPQGSLV